MLTTIVRAGALKRFRGRRGPALAVLLVALLAGCDESATAPRENDPAVEVPWARLTGRIAYSRTTEDPARSSRLFVIDAAARQIREVQVTGGASFRSLAWTPDGAGITYARYSSATATWALYTVSVSGGGTAITAAAADVDYAEPAWSRTGRLAYLARGARAGGDHEVWIDGAPFLRQGPSSASSLAWAPDGSHLLVSLGPQGSLYRVSVTDTVPVLLLQGGAGEFYHDPQYSPDGASVAYVRNLGEIWVMSADGTNRRLLTRLPYADGPSWSPDGLQIAFIAGATAYVVNADGTGLAPLVSSDINSWATSVAWTS